MTEKKDHKCTRRDLVESNKPLVESSSISLVYKCRICGRQFEKVYTPLRDDDWLYDRVRQNYVLLRGSD